jgi:hypothetical protein
MLGNELAYALPKNRRLLMLRVPYVTRLTASMNAAVYSRAASTYYPCFRF